MEFRRLEDIPWYHHNLTRNTCEVLLLSNGSPGSYLMRPSQTSHGQYTVSVRGLDSVKHFTLSYDGKMFTFGIGLFATLEHLLEHFENYPVLAGEAGPPITLKRPYPSKVEEPSDYDEISRHAVCGSSFKSCTLSAIDSQQEPTSMDWSVASKEGFLTKQGAFHKNWKKRWFVTNRNTLRYFNERGDRKPLRVLDLRLAKETCANSTCGRPFAFSIAFPGRTFIMCADSEKDMQEWIDLLKWKLAHMKGKQRSITA